MLSSDRYRPDIDGLRALAVLSVVFFHAYPEFVPGGYVGVDIFFVISGFLISGIIFRAVDSGDFGFVEFYIRRARRIFPALIVILFLVTLVGWLILFSDEFKQLGNHVWRASVFIVNFTFWRESGYFDVASESKVLLHLWSLAIEEQFYIVWPLVIIFIARFKFYRSRVILLLTICSFSWCVVKTNVDQLHGFYSPLTRFWELMLGGLLASWRSNYRESLLVDKFLNSGLGRLIPGIALLGFILIVFQFDSTTVFPGAWALLPAIIAAGFLALNRNHIAFGLLTTPVMVWFGKISFPLYLWHWPLLAFGRVVAGQFPDFGFRTIAVGLSILLAWTTYRWIETPLRFQVRQRTAMIFLLGGMIVIFSIGLAIHKNEGFPSRAIMSSANLRLLGDIGHEEFHKYHTKHFYPCIDAGVYSQSEVWRGYIRCHQSKQSSALDAILLGDSHAEHLFLGLAEQAPSVNLAYYIRDAIPAVSEPVFDYIFERVAASDAKVVIISALWAYRLRKAPGEQSAEDRVYETLRYFEAAGKKVYLIGDLPAFTFDPQRCKYLRPLSGKQNCTVPRPWIEERHSEYLPALERAVEKSSGTVLLRIINNFCDARECSMNRDGYVLFRDNNHLNIFGSRLAAHSIVLQIPEFQTLGEAAIDR